MAHVKALEVAVAVAVLNKASAVDLPMNIW